MRAGSSKVSFSAGAVSAVVKIEMIEVIDRQEGPMQPITHLPAGHLELGSTRTTVRRPPPRGQLPGSKPIDREPRPPRRLPGMDRGRPTVNIPQRRRMGVQR